MLGVMFVLPSHTLLAQAQTITELKSRVMATEIPHRPQLCIEIAERQLASYDKLYAAADIQNAQSALSDVVTFSEMAKDYSLQSHKREKQTEIAIRRMARKLSDLKHVVAHEDQATLQNALNRLQSVRDDLLGAMFPKARADNE